MKKRSVFFIAGITVLVIAGTAVLVWYFTGRNKTAAPASTLPDPADTRRLEELQAELRNAPDTLSIVEEILRLQVMNLEQIKDALSLAGEYGDALDDMLMAQIYIAVAECKMGGILGNVVEKVRWINRGMRHFDNIHRQWPGSEATYTYQVITYSHFPPIIGVYRDVLDLLSVMREKYRSGEWALDEGQADRLWLVFRNLREQYPKGAQNREIRDFARNMKEGLPLMAERPGAAEAWGD
jgi:hypothetical protein